MGDFNIDISTNSIGQFDYVNELAIKSISIHNTFITRPDSGSVIDHVATNLEEGSLLLHSIENDTNDHNIT